MKQIWADALICLEYELYADAIWVDMLHSCFSVRHGGLLEPIRSSQLHHLGIRYQWLGKLRFTWLLVREIMYYTLLGTRN